MDRTVVIRSAAPTPLWRWFNVVELLRDLWRQRELIIQFTWREVQSRFTGTSLGAAWPILEPISRLLVYTAIFFALGIRFGRSNNPMEYALQLFCGLVTFSIFADAVTRAPSAVLGRANLVKRVVFPLQIIPVSLVGSAFVFGLCGFAVTVIATLILLHKISWTLILLPVALVPLALLTLGLSWLLASLGVFVRDTRQMVSVVVSNLLFFLTPIIYEIDAIGNPTLRLVLQLNPLTTIVEDVRRTVLYTSPPQWAHWGVVTAFSAIVCMLGYVWFRKSERGFSDVI